MLITFPDLMSSLEPNYVDEADRFKADPGRFLSEHYANTEQLPDYVAVFNKVLPQISGFFVKYNYTVVHVFNG